jgi:hypothetical protein
MPFATGFYQCLRGFLGYFLLRSSLFQLLDAGYKLGFAGSISRSAKVIISHIRAKADRLPRMTSRKRYA